MMLDDATGNFYYANEETGDTTWERPERDGEDQDNAVTGVILNTVYILTYVLNVLTHT